MLKLRAQLSKRISEFTRRHNRNGCRFHWCLLKMTALSCKALFMQQKGHKQAKSSYQGLGPILFLHLLPQLLEAGLQTIVERPQRLGDLLSVDANTFGEVWDLAGAKH